MNEHMPAPAASAAQGGVPVQVAYVDRPGLARLALKNFVLNLLTFYVYRFWGKTAVRRHVWSSVHINGEPLEYTGTGRELFLGALIVFGLFILPATLLFLALTLMLGDTHPATIAAQFALILAAVLLYGFAIYRARRYRLSRTVWRGIRGALTGSAVTYGAKYFGALLLRWSTLGWSTPAMNLILTDQITNETRFGDQAFRFRGHTGPLYRRYAVCWFAVALLLIPAMVLVAVAVWFGFGDRLGGLAAGDDGAAGVGTVAAIFIAVLAAFAVYGIVNATIWTFYTAREMNVFAGYTTFGEARFRFDATPGSLIRLWLGNMAILIGSLGVLQPLVVQRTMRYFCDRLTVDGVVDFDAIGQSAARLDRRGEGLVEAFDLDAF